MTDQNRTCERAECGQIFILRTGYPSQRFCSKRCRELRYRDKIAPRLLADLARPTVGAINELVAGADLLRRGYEVFRALSPACSCDLVAFRNGQLLRIEVRGGSRNKQTGHVSYPRRASDRADHYCVVLGAGEEIYFEPPLPDDLAIVGRAFAEVRPIEAVQ